jgi:acyl carrier protein
MLRDKLINLISNILSINKTLISEDSNLETLYILSNYLEGLTEVEKKNVKINRESLKRTIPENIEYKGGSVYMDISSLFESDSNNKVIYKDNKGRDSFYNFQILEVLLILEIENKFDIQIPDHLAENITTVGQVISYIKNSK